MKNMILFFLFLSIFNTANIFASSLKRSQIYENKYFAIDHYFLGNDSNILIDYIWDQSDEENTRYVVKKLNDFDKIKFSKNNLLRNDLSSKLRLLYLKTKYNFNAKPLTEEIIYQLSLPENKLNKSAIILLNYQTTFKKLIGEQYVTDYLKSFDGLVSTYKSVTKNLNIISKEQINDVFYRSPNLTNGGTKLFMFCRHNRKFPCLFLMRDHNDQIVLNKNGEIWSQPALASSKHDFPSNKRNGNTPTGILRIDSVMPKANKKILYGKYRRFILEFISKSRNEDSIKRFLPKSSWNLNWWKANTIARDVGRILLRIHGTGLRNNNSNSTFYPFVRTSGCIAQRENRYGQTKFKDQRLLLDTFMKSMGLNAKYSNEPKVKGLIYVLNIDSKEKNVTLDDLKNLLDL